MGGGSVLRGNERHERQRTPGEAAKMRRTQPGSPKAHRTVGAPEIEKSDQPHRSPREGDGCFLTDVPAEDACDRADRQSGEFLERVRSDGVEERDIGHEAEIDCGERAQSTHPSPAEKLTRNRARAPSFLVRQAFFLV